MDYDAVQYLEEEVDLRHYLSLLKRHFRILLSVTVIAASVAAIYAFKLPDYYQADTQVILRPEGETTYPTPYAEIQRISDSGGLPGDAIYYNTQIEIVKSLIHLSRTVKENNLMDALFEYKRAKFSKDTSEEYKLRVAAGIVREGLSVYRMKDTRIFNLSFRSANPTLCREVANAVARSYVKQHLEQKLFLPTELMQFFPEDAEKIQLETPYGQLREIRQGEIAKILPSVVNDPLIRALKARAADTEALLAKLRETFKEKHPKVVEAKATLKFIRDRTEIETGNVIRNLKTSLTSQLQVQSVRILKEAEIPRAPVGPDRMKIILMAVFGSVIVVGIIIFGIDYLDDTIKSQEDIEKFIHLPFLGHVPFHREKIKDIHQKAFLVHYNPLSQVSESVRLIKVAVNFSGAPGTLKCLLVTSAVPAEGKSFVSISLACSFLTDGEKVLLVDGDMRHPTIHLLANTDSLKGLSNYLTSDINLSEVIQNSVIANLDIVSSGPLSPNPTELFASYRMDQFIKEAKGKYDRIVFDSPPVVGLADSLVLGTKTNGVVFLIEARRVSRKLIRKLRQRLLETGVKILGVVINKMDLERDEPTYRYYASSYYRVYGKKRKESSGKDESTSSGG